MKHVRKSVLLPYSPHEMYSLVTAIQAYPEFLPWCDRSQVMEQRADGVTARLGLAYMGIRQAFTTRNTHVADTSVAMKLVDGPFSLLDGLWTFQPLGLPGGEQSGCKVEFDLRYAFSGIALELLVSPVFDRIADTFVDSFVKRAQRVHGAR